MRRFFLLCILIIVGQGSYSQTVSNVHIVTEPRNRMPGFGSFHFTVNGTSYKLKAGDCLDLQVQGNTIDIVVQDKRIVKQKSEELHTPATAEVYVWVLLKFKGTFKEPNYAAELICKSCYEERRKECKGFKSD